ncbi:MAG: glycosyltransferase family 2 protein [bacterium]
MIHKEKKIQRQSDGIEISVIIPLYNEVENLELLFSSIKNVLDGLDKTYEMIYIDDGSTDGTFEVLKRKADSNTKVIKFRKNFGQSAAMAAGFEHAKGQVVISMDGDLQNDPKDIPAMVAKLEEGFDIVAGWRKNRKDKMFIRKVPSKIANKIIRFFTGVQLHDTGCSLKAYRSEVIKRLRLYGELHRFIPALARIEGAKISEIVVSHHARKFGRSKYNLSRTFKVIMDLTTINLFIKYLSNPVYLFGKLGFFFNLFGLMTLFVCLYLIILENYDLSGINVLVSLAFLLIASGCQFIFYGLIANMVVKTAEEKNGQIIEYFKH